MFPLEQTQCLDLTRFDACIDVRSPREFDEDHIPGAINLPVLDDEERSRVGCLYSDSRFEGRLLGASLISKNIGNHLSGPLKGKGRDFRSLVYCWRGGQRSQSLGYVMRQVGWSTTLLEGGYKTYRRRVIDDLERIPSSLQFRTLAGLTGTAKTDILKRMRMIGAQVLDLEGLANHRGSLLGGDPGAPQPSQKMFESRLWEALRGFDPNVPVWLESESNRIGNRQCPSALWQMIKRTDRVEVVAPIWSRVDYLIHQYEHFLRDPEALLSKLKPLKGRYGKGRLATWAQWIQDRDWRRFVQDILEIHYDPAYQNSMETNNGSRTRQIAMDDLTETSQHRVASLLCSSPPLVSSSLMG